jgi:uncharacterized protein
MAVRVEPGPDHDWIRVHLCERLRLCGNDINDAYLAALAFVHGATLVTADQDFARFPELPLIDPLAAPRP